MWKKPRLAEKVSIFLFHKARNYFMKIIKSMAKEEKMSRTEFEKKIHFDIFLLKQTLTIKRKR